MKFAIQTPVLSGEKKDVSFLFTIIVLKINRL